MRPGRPPSVSHQKLDAKGLVAAPDHFATLASVVGRYQHDDEMISDIHLGVGDDPGAAGRNVEHRAFKLRRSVAKH